MGVLPKVLTLCVTLAACACSFASPGALGSVGTCGLMSIVIRLFQAEHMF